MRVVERSKDTQSVAYLITKYLGMAAGIFSVVVCLLMIFNNLMQKRADPIHVEALSAMIDQLSDDPSNKELRLRIQELDQLARGAFFRSQSFNRVSIYLLFSGLLVMIACFKLQGRFHDEVPYPDNSDPRDDLIVDATFGRWAIGGMGLMLVGFTLILALNTDSQLAGMAKSLVAGEGGAVVSNLPTKEQLVKNWPSFRGYEGKGIARIDGVPPVKWDGPSGENILWKTKIPKPGFNTPIYWEGKLFMSGGDKDGREVYCVDGATGELLWTTAISGIEGSPAEAPKVASDTGHAAAGMATDGTHVFAVFSTGNVVALDFEGKLIWGRNLGHPENPYGHSSSLVVFEDLLIVQYDHENMGKLMALETRTGRDRWEMPRSNGASWSSPLVANVEGKWQIITATNPVVSSYDPRSGKELWRMEVLGGEVAPMPTIENGVLYVAADYVKVAGIDLATQTVLWEKETDIPGVSTPLPVNGLLFIALSDGGIVCRDGKSGEEVWYQDTDEGFYASPILAGGNVYLMDRSGTMHIFPAHREYQEIAKNALDEQAVASPVFVGSDIFYRAYTHLYKIGKGS